jgi:hypothetical protein
MIWKTVAHDAPPIHEQRSDRAWPMESCTWPDGFGLPLIGALFGYQAAEEPEWELAAFEETPRAQG